VVVAGVVEELPVLVVIIIQAVGAELAEVRVLEGMVDQGEV
jgi:hypothetical protein